ncbi:lactate permease [Sulfolobus sp. A20]|uniref:L-lactate permease n=1 Tax=Saccharolobus sp. A20 TaxID=1891280 RepID=UPI0008462212|nr:lactate permease [Sulfolobus sp. A20]TRM75693.1 L-lactate permease [Sulfolobus sp. A20-N-F8]TRM78216.1 L-lactate permease [Sulfolobus sp. B5]TRM81903.1 L-lactate permease [Sulfolobus sp. D5]TRM84042.1 L-lactate permease [Sulfolobus sp. A20-N-F6]TRM86176.1 L-lactate permease [Sulfolobus sp. C3]TRN03634.1 L-lactate permease [Sulfolobus sp. E1]
MFTQPLNPTGNVGLTILASLTPIIVLLILLAGLRLSAWLASLIGSIVTILVAILVWRTPVTQVMNAWLIGALVGTWAISWIVFWGLTIYNTLVLTGKFDAFKDWVIRNSTNDARIQAVLLAWSFGALLEGLVGFGYPWAFVAPLLIALGFEDLKALQVSALANNAPVSFGALGTPIVILAATTGLPLLFVSSSVAKVVAILALLPPWILLYLVDRWKGIKDVWPMAIVASLAYILGQYPIASFVGPYLPDITGSLVSFIILLLFLRVWRPKRVLSLRQLNGGGGNDKKYTTRDVIMAWSAFIILIIIVTLWTGPWSPLTKVSIATLEQPAFSTLLHKKVAVSFAFNPFVAGTSILVSWIVISIVLRASPRIMGEAIKRSFMQYWGGILTGVFVVGLAYVFNFSGMAYSLAWKTSDLGLVFIIVSPLFGWLGCALSGSNTSSNALFGVFQVTTARLAGLPIGLTPALNSVGAELAKPVAPQTASAGVSTTKYVRKEGVVIRANLPWAIGILIYLIIIGVVYAFLAPTLFLP